MKWHFKKSDNPFLSDDNGDLYHSVSNVANDLQCCMYKTKGDCDRDLKVTTVASAWQVIACVEAVIRSHDKDVVEAGREKYDSLVSEKFWEPDFDAESEIAEVLGDFFDALMGGDDE